MALPRQIVVKPIGLVTQPNKLGVFPPGACSQAKDMIMRSPASMQQAYTKTAGWATTGQRSRLLASTANQVIALQRSSGGVWSIQWITPSLTSPTLNSGTLPYTTDDFSTTGRLQAITMRGRTIVNGATKDPIVADYENPSSSAQRTFRLAGLPQPIISPTYASTTKPQAVAVDTVVTYCALLKRTFVDGYILRSRPSLIHSLFAGGSPRDTDVIVSWPDGSLVAGDTVEIYRSQSLPVASGVVSQTMYRVATVLLSSSDAAADTVTVTDTAVASDIGGPLNGLGEELYTNPGFGGASAVSEDPPPVSACVAQFRGRTFFARCRYPASVKLSMRNGVGFLLTDEARANGIGNRNITANWTSGNTTVSGVSATDMLGIAPGQFVSGTGFTFPNSRVATVGASSFTVTVAPSSSATGGSLSTLDAIEVDGVEYTTFALTNVGFPVGYRRTSTQSLVATYFSSLDTIIQKEQYVAPATLSIRASRGNTYDPKLPLMSQSPLVIQPTELKSQIRWSLDQRPEAVPPANEAYVGNGEIYAMIATRDALWFFCSDGLFRLTGTIAPIDGIPDIIVDEIDGTLIIAGPRAWCVLRDKVYAYTNRGLVEISNSAIRELTTGRVGDLLPGAFWAEAETPFLVADERVDEIYIIGAHATLNFVYSVRYDCLSTTAQFDGAQTGVQVATSLALVFGYATTTLDELQPDLTPLLSNGPILDLQPVFGDRPDTVKQWIDATYIFENGSSGAFDARFNGAAQPFVVISEAMLAAENDLRTNVGIGRDAPAHGSGIAPGLAIITSAGLKKLAAISLRYAPITEQVGRR